ncbi:hypothetical protein M406DRAFT_70487 [Cryphonectria parasitica EP155]|uniref:WSC domain-containing protein n=1 Tax=Cryphonectria parasitica (strain ATCC 38755 / EP155) TaxID=660469 RepID=A0A9P5CN25_CRYP1|nr:uncharacterized protein M406DRAFT_70487 [Cryphonectria parasitica EP155]KAF3765004.1 hypothetical protein M406DRAFT_70487 [Cryphonectria parasitica EP155]
MRLRLKQACPASLVTASQPLILPVLLLFPLLDSTQATHSSGLRSITMTSLESTTTTALTITTSSTRTITLTEVTAAAAADTTTASNVVPAPRVMTKAGKMYSFEGCFGHGKHESIGEILGPGYTAPWAANMSLSLCLNMCNSAAAAGGGGGGGGGDSNGTSSLPYVGVSDGESCYCSATLTTTAPIAPTSNCTIPCVGNKTEACGGRAFMSIYKLASDNSTAVAPKINNAPLPSDSAGASNGNVSSKSRRGVAVGITAGSIAGFALLMLLIFGCTRRWTQRRAATAATMTTTSTRHKEKNAPEVDVASANDPIGTVFSDSDDCSIRDVKRVDLAKLDGVVLDNASSTPMSSPRAVGAVATTTGAEWRGEDSSPLTPRTPRAMMDGRPVTMSLWPQPPESIAPKHGLGERAWHRRKLSVPFPPPGGSDTGSGKKN